MVFVHSLICPPCPSPLQPSPTYSPLRIVISVKLPSTYPPTHPRIHSSTHPPASLPKRNLRPNFTCQTDRMRANPMSRQTDCTTCLKSDEMPMLEPKPRGLHLALGFLAALESRRPGQLGPRLCIVVAGAQGLDGAALGVPPSPPQWYLRGLTGAHSTGAAVGGRGGSKPAGTLWTLTRLSSPPLLSSLHWERPCSEARGQQWTQPDALPHSLGFLVPCPPCHCPGWEESRKGLVLCPASGD